MSTTAVWFGDIKAVSWQATTTAGAAVDLSSATVQLIAKPEGGGASVILTNSVATSVVSHTLTGTLPVGRYQIVIKATQGAQPITYPDPNAEQHYLTVSAALG